MKVKILVFTLACLIVLPLNLTAKEKRGANLIVEKLDGQLVSGELITIKDRSLLLLSESGADVSVDVDEIKVISVIKKSKAVKGLVQGTSCGAIVGLIGYALISSAESDDYFGPSGLGVLAPIIFIPLGAIIGTTVGAVAGADKAIQIEGKSKVEIKHILLDLRQAARIPDYN